MSARLQLQELSYAYSDSQAAVSQLSLDIAPGELVALLGPSGCGKTTTLQLISGLLQPAAGDVLIEGRSVLGLAPEQRDIALVFQKGLLFEHMDVASNVGFGLRMRGVAKRDIREAVNTALAQVHMATFGSRRPRELSGGEQQRVALARALVTDPKVMMLDEPLSSLDASLRGDMRELVRSVQQAGGHTTLFVTHDQQEAIRLADRIALMFDGKLQMFAPPSAFYERPATRQIAEFFGAVNFIEGHVDGDYLYSELGKFALANQPPSGPCTATVRPEKLRLLNHLGDPPASQNCIQAKVISAQYLGTHMQYVFAYQGQQLQGDLPLSSELNPGDTAWIELPADALWVFGREHDAT